jgi:hypothetical protein
VSASVVSLFPSRSADAQAFVLPPDVNSVILENLTALVGASTAALLDKIDTADGASDARIALMVK